MRNKIILQKSITINEYIEILEKEKYLFILDSSKVNDNQSNYTYIGVNPVDYLIIDRDDQNKIEILEDLNSFYKRYSKRTDQGIEKEKFYTGFLSFFSYDLGLIFMDIDKDKTKTKSRVPYSFIGYYPVIIRIDKEGNSILYYEEEYKNKAKDLIDKVNIGYGNISKEKENKNGYPNNKYNLIYEEKFKEYEKK